MRKFLSLSAFFPFLFPSLRIQAHTFLAADQPVRRKRRRDLPSPPCKRQGRWCAAAAQSQKKTRRKRRQQHNEAQNTRGNALEGRSMSGTWRGSENQNTKAHKESERERDNDALHASRAAGTQQYGEERETQKREGQKKPQEKKMPRLVFGVKRSRKEKKTERKGVPRGARACVSGRTRVPPQERQRKLGEQRSLQHSRGPPAPLRQKGKNKRSGCKHQRHTLREKQRTKKNTAAQTVARCRGARETAA